MTLRTAWHDALFAARMMTTASLEKLTTGILFDPTDAAMRADPYPFYRRLRERDPMHRSFPGGGWVLSRYDDVKGVLSDRSYSADERNWTLYPKFRARAAAHGLSDPYDEDRMTMLRTDPPDHTRLRRLVSKAFTPRAVESLRGRAEQILDELLAGRGRHGRLELVSDLAAPFPIVMIAEMLGVPAEDRERFRHWSDEAVKTLGDNTMAETKEGLAAMQAFGDYIEEIAAQRRAEPRDDLLSGLVAAEEEGDRLSMSELRATCVLLMVAGNETTTSLIGNAVLALLAHPEQAALLRDEPKRVAGAVDELLRYDSPVQLTSRIATRDGELHGARVRAGQQMVLLLGSANRDPSAFERPDELDVTRDAGHHLSFSFGLHRCLGAQLAKLEGELALGSILSRFPDLRLGDAPERAVAWGTNTVLRGPKVLHLAY